MIYFVQAENQGIKIGHSILGAKHRLKAMQVGCPLKLTLLGTIKGHTHYEKALHTRFKRHRIRGEWFSMDIKPAVESLIGTTTYPAVSRLQEINSALATTRDEKAINRLVREKEGILSLDWV